MHFLFKVIIVFMIIFNWRLEYVYNSVFLAMIITTIYYIYDTGFIPFKYFFQRYNATILIASVLLTVLVFAIPVIHGTTVVTTYEKRIWVQFLMLFAMIYALPLLIKGEEEVAFERISVIICYTFALQGLIHLTGFLVPAVGDFLFEMKPIELQRAVMNPDNHIARFRAYSMTGSVFFELPAAYGVAAILFFRLMLYKDQQYITGWRTFIITFFILAGISLSGRTGFIGFGVGLGLWLLFNYKRIVHVLLQNAGKIIIIVAFFTVTFNFIISPSQRQAFNDDLFPYAFEFYYNWRDHGRLSTTSSDINFSEEFYYPMRDETLFAGHGLERDELELVGYNSTDAGYMRSIMFGGIPFLLCLIFYQGLFFYKPLLVSNSGGTRASEKDFWCFLFLFIYMFFLHLKENAMGIVHIVETLYIAAGSSYLIRYYSRDEGTEFCE